MFDITQEQLDKLRMQFPKGAKVRLVKMDDFQAPPIGTEGEVTEVDDTGTIHVQWATGSTSAQFTARTKWSLWTGS